MKKIFKISLLMAILAITVLGCKKDSDKPDNPKPPNVDMQTVVLQGIVTDINENPLGGVQVTTGSTTVATTDADGRFIITKVGVVNKRAVLKFEKQGYYTLTRSGAKESEMFIKAVLHRKGNSDISTQSNFNTESGSTLKVGEMKVEIPSSSIMKANGSAYNGTVKADMLYLNPDHEKFSDMMPGGDLAGERTDGSASMLISYGMSNVTFTDNSGNPLQLKSGAKAKVTFPVPESMKNNPPKSMPLWSFDEDKGTWIEEGVFTLEGGVYVGQATHFSWINCDDPEPPREVKGLVVDCNNEPLPNVEVFSGQTSIRTNSKGEFSGMLPANTASTLSVTVFGVTVTRTISAGTTPITVPTFEMPCGVKIKGKVIDCDSRPFVNLKVSTEITATYTDSKGEFVLVIPANTPVTVKASSGGETESESVPGKPQGTIVTLREFKLCGGTEEPGTYSNVEKASIKVRYGMSDDVFAIYTWDKKGMRFRMDMLDQEEDKESRTVILINHILKTTVIGYNDEDEPEWTSQTYNFGENPVGFSLSIDENAMSAYRVYPDVNIAGKVCKVFKMSYSGYQFTYATWNGVIMQYEMDGQLIWVATAVTLDVPEVAFTQTFKITWLP